MARYKLPRRIVDRQRYLLELCTGRRILHLGCGNWPSTEQRILNGTLIHSRLTAAAAHCLGIELSSESVALLRASGINNVEQGDAEHLDLLRDTGPFDVVVAGELIEHLNNPGQFLDSARAVLTSGGVLAITTVNAFCVRRSMRVLLGVESVHPDHCCYFSHSTLNALANRYGYKLVDACSYALDAASPSWHRMVEGIVARVSPNLCEGIIHLYRA
ncbi:MAG: class I SAM-dependent methyltransferase [Terriglobales bacterium]